MEAKELQEIYEALKRGEPVAKEKKLEYYLETCGPFYGGFFANDRKVLDKDGKEIEGAFV